MALRLNDQKTLLAIEILADVLDELAGPERLECLMAANALRQVLETRSETALGFAQQAFESLDGTIRQQIHSEATEAAIRVVDRRRGKGKARSQTRSSGAAIIDALQGGKGGMTTERKW